MKRLATVLLTCTILEAIQSIRPGAQWSLAGTGYAGLTWLDPIQTTPTLAEVQAAMSQCQTNEALLKQQIQTDLFNINLSTNTAAQKLPALLDLLKQRGLLQ